MANSAVGDDNKNISELTESADKQQVDSDTKLTDSKTNETTDEKVTQKSKRRRGKRKAKNDSSKEKKIRVDYKPIPKENENLVAYYKQQDISNGQFDKFMWSLKESLPASFRINTFDKAQAAFLRSYIEGPVMNKLQEYTDDLEKKEENKQFDFIKSSDSGLNNLEWYPSRLAWQMNVTRLDLRKIPILQQLHQFLLAETDVGFISRQEAVSMIPPLAMDIKPGFRVLDMCAAPGSKTAQLLEYLKSGQPNSSSNLLQHLQHKKKTTDNIDDGIVVANDVDNKRCYMLVHQSNRLNSPNCVIINEDASKISNLKITNEESELSRLKFDRILCDVPCSGDGTIRKNPDVWKKWSVGNANNFHGLQSKILKRGLSLLKKDGILVYSTCSMNPIEDEAVICSALRSSLGGVELVSPQISNLEFIPGISHWIVMNRDMQIIPNVDQVPKEQICHMYPSLFPPTSDEAKKFNLSLCYRILPHLQNTGGFFIAVLKKLVNDLPWDESKPVEENESGSNQASKPKSERKKRYGGFKEDPFIFMDENDPDWPTIKTSFGLTDQFPVNQLVHRCKTGNKRSIYLVSKTCRNFILSNQEDGERKEFVKIINAGMRLFIRSNSDFGFRIAQDGINEVIDYIRDDLKILINDDDFKQLVMYRKISIDSLSSEVSSKIKSDIKVGSFVLIYKHKFKEGETEVETDLPLVAWKGEFSVSLYVSDKYRVHLATVIGIDLKETCLKDKKFS